MFEGENGSVNVEHYEILLRNFLILKIVDLGNYYWLEQDDSAILQKLRVNQTGRRASLLCSQPVPSPDKWGGLARKKTIQP
jgi:hypothetical protein